MFIDASVVVAILTREDGYAYYLGRMDDYKGKFLYSPLVRFEATAAIARKRSGQRKPTEAKFADAAVLVQDFFDSIRAREVTINSTVGEKAIAVAGRYGKMVGHEADLNFGDCYSYACAETYDTALLYKGDDFSKTDLA